MSRCPSVFCPPHFPSPLSPLLPHHVARLVCGVGRLGGRVRFSLSYGGWQVWNRSADKCKDLVDGAHILPCSLRCVLFV